MHDINIAINRKNIYKKIMIDTIENKIKGLANCKPDVSELAYDCRDLSVDECETLIRAFIESGNESGLTIFLNACAVNEIRIDPSLLAESVRVAESVADLCFIYKFQDHSAIDPLLDLFSSERISFHRLVSAMFIVTELAVSFDTKRKEVKLGLNRLLNNYVDSPSSLFIHDCLELIEEGKADFKEKGHIFGIERNVLESLPETKPRKAIGGTYTVRRAVAKIGRNDSCHCGSGKKYKKCCIEKDKALLQDSSQYEGLTLSQVKEAPELVDDADIIERMEPHALQQLDLVKLNDDQLFAAYLRAQGFELHGLCFTMLMALKTRPGKKEFAEEHMVDVLFASHDASDLKLSEKIVKEIPEEKIVDDDGINFGLFLMKNQAFFDEFEVFFRMFLLAEGFYHDSPLIRLAHNFTTKLPALSIVFGRAAIAGKGLHNLDNEMLIKAIRNARIELGLDEIEDPIEDFCDWLLIEEESSLENRLERKEIELKNLLAEEKLKAAEEKLSEIREKEKELLKNPVKPEHTINNRANLANVRPVVVASKPTVKSEPELRQQISRLKDEIREQQKKRQDLKDELEKEKTRTTKMKRESEQQYSHNNDASIPVQGLPESILVPEFSAKFRKTCETTASAVTAKAIKAAAGFSCRDLAVLANTKKIETAKGLYRIKIERNYRLMVKYESDRLMVLDLINRKDLELWLKKY